MRLWDFAHARAGDKGDTSNISVIVYNKKHYPWLVDFLTAELVRDLYAIDGDVERYELPQLGALNFVLPGALKGGVTRSLALDAHGKCLSSLILSLEVDHEDTASP